MLTTFFPHRNTITRTVDFWTGSPQYEGGLRIQCDMRVFSERNDVLVSYDVRIRRGRHTERFDRVTCGITDAASAPYDLIVEGLRGLRLLEGIPDDDYNMLEAAHCWRLDLQDSIAEFGLCPVSGTHPHLVCWNFTDVPQKEQRVSLKLWLRDDPQIWTRGVTTVHSPFHELDSAFYESDVRELARKLLKRLAWGQAPDTYALRAGAALFTCTRCGGVYSTICRNDNTCVYCAA